MTLYIKVDKIQMDQAFKGNLFVEGSQSGLLWSPQIKWKDFHFDPAFNVICSATDSLVFKLCSNKEAYKEGQIRAKANFHSPAIIKQYKKNLHLHDGYQYILSLYDGEDNECGTLTCSIRYDKASHFLGDYCTTLERPSRNKLPLYIGHCATKNFFSMLDAHADGQQEKMIQSIYVDDD